MEPADARSAFGPVGSAQPSERAGLPAVERDVEARIPIEGAESLNVAAAGSIALYEWRRQNPSL